MSKQNLYVGKSGEEAAVSFLKQKGYKILFRNYRAKFGEIDIIARDNTAICFVEVKTRRIDKFGMPAESVTKSKQIQISKVALSFLKENNLLNKKARFDVVSVEYAEADPKLDLIKNAFELHERFTP